ncbi:MAG: cobalamin biosynthesis protein [Proteobacteria bacterium]|nr:cobalamin biosynthesis protein [Pseudomonadota bacterium]
MPSHGALAAGPGPLVLLLFALALDAYIGDPPGVWRVVPHPVALMGRAVAFLDKRLNRAGRGEGARALRGVMALAVLVGLAAACGWAFSWAADALIPGMRKSLVTVENGQVVRTSHLNGVLLTLTPAVIDRVGGFQILPGPWGHTHVNWTKRIVKAGLAPFFADVCDSNRYVGINRFGEQSVFSSCEKQRFAAQNRVPAENLSRIHYFVEE